MAPDDAWLCLLQLGEPRIAAELLAAEGSAAAVLRLPRQRLTAAGLRPEAIDRVRKPDQALLARWQQWLTHERRALVPRDDPRYPPLLAELPDAPLALWIEGAKPELLRAPQLAIVGSRNPTANGRETAERFAHYLGQRGLTITSGLASGIDGAAHRGALTTAGGTVAVLGGGLGSIFPREHEQLAGQLIESGLLASEYAPDVAPRRAYFPQRNRIIAGLSVGTLVVEATRRSGSLITARLAGECGREIFAIPGSIHNPLARGCHALIRQGAKLVEDAGDLLVELAPLLSLELGANGGDGGSAPAEPALLADRPGYRQLLEALGFEPVDTTQLANRTGLTAAELSSMLLQLELEDFVESLPGGRYARLIKRQR